MAKESPEERGRRYDKATDELVAKHKAEKAAREEAARAAKAERDAALAKARKEYLERIARENAAKKKGQS
jgi:hypothetical protein